MGLLDIALWACALFAGVLASAALGALSLSPPEFRVSRVCIWLGASSGIVAVVLWGLLTDVQLVLRLIVIFILAGAVVSMATEAARWVSGREAATHNLPAVPPEAMADFKAIDEFIGRKDEIELRNEFDFPKILDFNIKFQKRNLAPHLVTREESDEIDGFFKGGQGRLDVRFANIRAENNTVKVEWIPGKIGVINTSAKCVESRIKLNHLIASAYLPSDVQDALSELDDTLDKNLTLMIEALNETLIEDPRNIIQNFDYGSSRYGVASGLYWSRFIPLKPKAEKIIAAIRSHLKLR